MLGSKQMFQPCISSHRMKRKSMSKKLLIIIVFFPKHSSCTHLANVELVTNHLAISTVGHCDYLTISEWDHHLSQNLVITKETGISLATEEVDLGDQTAGVCGSEIIQLSARYPNDNTEISHPDFCSILGVWDRQHSKLWCKILAFVEQKNEAIYILLHFISFSQFSAVY